MPASTILSSDQKRATSRQQSHGTDHFDDEFHHSFKFIQRLCVFWGFDEFLTNTNHPIDIPTAKVAFQNIIDWQNRIGQKRVTQNKQLVVQTINDFVKST
eukprot:m.807474 g.807474  ORF g.807474 m.807474 type:complete len:100 (-) comp23379_c1_seq5:237-536(-)